MQVFLTFLSLQEAQNYVTVQLCDCLSVGQRVCETMLKSGKLAAWLLRCSHGSGLRGHNRSHCIFTLLGGVKHK